MKKYIRTADGIYEVEDEIFAPGGEDEPNELWFKVVGKAELINSRRILAQADNPEELCDGFYLYNGYDEEFCIDNRIFKLKDKNMALEEYTHLKTHIEIYCRDRYVCELYAFIETPKGLKFVAKMNEKGELELI